MIDNYINYNFPLMKKGKKDRSALLYVLTKTTIY